MKELKEFTEFFKSVFFKKAARKRRYLQYLVDNGVRSVLAPVPVATRWNSFFNTVIYHAEHFDLYLEFFSQEAITSQSGLMTQLVSKLSDPDKLRDMKIMSAFVTCVCPKIISLMTLLESQKPLAPEILNFFDDMEAFLMNGTARTVLGDVVDDILDAVPLLIKINYLDKFHDIFTSAFQKLSKHLDVLPAKAVYKQVRVFDPRQVPAMPRDLSNYTSLISMSDQDVDLSSEWMIYQRECRDSSVPNGDGALLDYWNGNALRFPKLSRIAKTYIWFPLTSCDVERSFSMYKHFLTDRRDSLKEERVSHLIILHYNKSLT
jgi:hypothetical protein